MTYQEQIKDPRWQKKRLEILNRDEFTCQHCGATDKTLHVHHLKYEKGKKAWEVRKIYLITLCEECHSVYDTAIKKSHEYYISDFIKRNGLAFMEVEMMIVSRLIRMEDDDIIKLRKERLTRLIKTNNE